MNNVDKLLLRYFARLRQINSGNPELYTGERGMIIQIIEAIYKDQGWVKK